MTVIKKDINEDGNPNCKWRNIELKQESKSVDEAKQWLNDNIDSILREYELHYI